MEGGGEGVAALRWLALPQFCSPGCPGKAAHVDTGSFYTTRTPEIPAIQEFYLFFS